MSDLIAITYENEQTGFDALNKLAELQKMQLITLADAAVATKDQKGKVKVKQTLENQVAGSAAAWGGFWGLFIGLLFLGGTLRAIRRGRLLRASSSFVSGAMSVCLGAIAAMILISYLGYERLTAEQLVGVIEFQRHHSAEAEMSAHCSGPQ